MGRPERAGRPCYQVAVVVLEVVDLVLPSSAITDFHQVPFAGSIRIRRELDTTHAALE